jgi:hypothetical protein
MAEGGPGLPLVRVRLPDGKIQERNDVRYRSRFSLLRYIVETVLGFGPVRLHVTVDGVERELEDDDYVLEFYDGKTAPLIVATKK